MARRAAASARSWARRAASPKNRWFTLALIVGFGLRLVWVLWATADPSGPYSDTAQHLSMADQFSRLQTYRINGNLSAYHAPGYPFLLTPFALVARLTSAFSLSFAAALVNVAAGTATIALGALLARHWIGDRARTPAAWLLAVAAGPIYLTSIALNETVHTATILAALLVITAIVQGSGPVPRGTLVGLGALVGWATLVRSTGAVVLLIAVVALRQREGSWRRAGRPAALVIVVAVAVLAPWTVRNGVQVGVWAPSANGAAFLCHGHRDGADAAETDMTDAEISACFVGTAYGPDPDEGRWYRETVRDAISWALAHPGEEIRLSLAKTVALYADDSQSVADAADFGARDLAGPDGTQRLVRLSDVWHRLVLALGALGLVVNRRTRQAWPLWGTVLGLTVAVWGGSALDRYHHSIMAILTVFASATMVTMGRWASAGIRSMAEKEEVGDEGDAPPPPPGVGIARAARGSSRLAGPDGHPVAPILLGMATGAWVAALAFDAVSFLASTEWAYARGAWMLTGLGLLAGLVGAFAVLSDLMAIPRGTVAFRIGLRHLLALDAALVCFTLSFVVRNASDFVFHDSSPPVAVAFSLLGLAALVAMHWLGGILTFRYGVRVALGPERRKGFEPVEPD